MPPFSSHVSSPAWLHGLRARLARGLRSALPRQDCLLCGTPGQAGLICADCRNELPLLDAHRCPRCAQPTPGGMTCGACLTTAPHFDATFARWRYDYPLDGLIQALKYSHRLALAEFFADSLLDGPRPAGDLVLPLPLSPARLRERGFNQAVEIARPIARILRLPLALDLCLRAETPPQAGLPWKQRRKNVRHAFECRADLSGARILVVDDVMTTGATLDELARTLKKHGAREVINWVVARTTKDHASRNQALRFQKS